MQKKVAPKTTIISKQIQQSFRIKVQHTKINYIYFVDNEKF